MAEYVEREALLQEMTVNALPRDAQHLYLAMRGMVRNAPTADVVEVRHGEWVEENDGTHSCSECGHDATYTYDGTEICGIGCPFCYALMDGKGDNDG